MNFQMPQVSCGHFNGTTVTKSLGACPMINVEFRYDLAMQTGDLENRF